jgi:predicted Zn-dependent protease
MSRSRPAARVLPVLTALLVGAVAADVARRIIARPDPAAPGTDSTSVGASAGQVVRRAPAPPDTAADVRRRAVVRRRLEIEGASTYLPDMLPETDSAVRRWPDQLVAGRALRVAVLRGGGVASFREEFAANVSWAVNRWNSANLPVRLETGADSSTADIVVTWVRRLDGNRTGRTDVTWDTRGHIRRAEVFLATHTPDGQPLDTRQMTALALHELGHALGLGHSPSRDDALYPITRALELSDRDRRTARLLYDLPPGSLRTR